MSLGGGISGGLSGAASGAAIGSVVPGIGTAIGAIGGGLLGALGGGFGSKKQSFKNPFEIAQDSLEFRGTFLPGYLKQQQEFAPQFTALDLALMQDFAPQFAAIQRDILNQANPVQAQALQGLGEVLSAASLADVALDPALQRALQQNIRASQSARGVLNSPISAVTEAIRTAELGANERNRRQQLALALAGQIPTVLPNQLSSESIVPNISGLQSQANQSAYNRFALQQQQQGKGLNMLGTALDSFGTFAGQGGFDSLFGGSGGANTGGMNLNQAAQTSGGLLNYRF